MHILHVFLEKKKEKQTHGKGKVSFSVLFQLCWHLHDKQADKTNKIIEKNKHTNKSTNNQRSKGK